MKQGADVEHANRVDERGPSGEGRTEIVQVAWVKFREGLRIELANGKPVDRSGRALTSPEARRLLESIGASDWMRMHHSADADLDRVRERARAGTNRAIPDFKLYYHVRPPGKTPAGQLAEDLRRLDEVEDAGVTSPEVITFAPPDFSVRRLDAGGNELTSQLYLRRADWFVNGLGAAQAWLLPGGDGSGVRVCNIDVGWDSHDDLPAPITLIGGMVWHGDHGRKMLGPVFALNDGVGMRGIASGATPYVATALTPWTTFPFAVWNIANAVIVATRVLSAGDVLYIGVGEIGPSGLVPCEWLAPTHAAITAAVAAGIHVVVAAGNDGQNLDDAAHSAPAHTPFARASDSGAIYVGAGSSVVPAALALSNYGSRIDLQAWGHDVLTTGGGDVYSEWGANLPYTIMGGTSAASALVAGIVASLQGIMLDRTAAPLAPALMRSLIARTGRRQFFETDQEFRLLGPSPNVSRALDRIRGIVRAPVVRPRGGRLSYPFGRVRGPLLDLAPHASPGNATSELLGGRGDLDIDFDGLGGLFEGSVSPPTRHKVVIEADAWNAAPDPALSIHYTTDGNDPDSSSPTTDRPFGFELRIAESFRLKAMSRVAVDEPFISTPTNSAIVRGYFQVGDDRPILRIADVQSSSLTVEMRHPDPRFELGVDGWIVYDARSFEPSAEKLYWEPVSFELDPNQAIVLLAYVLYDNDGHGGSVSQISTLILRLDA